MISFPNCKINLGLHVVGKRTDGFHDLESVFFPIPFFDVLEFVPAEKTSFHYYGLPISGNPENNLIHKAYQLLKGKFNLPSIEVHLLKKIPMGGGMGGGSSNGSFMLKMLNEHFDLGISSTELARLSEQLGSDCPFFIENKPTLVKGRGEKLYPVKVKLKDHFLVLVFSNIHVSTKEAFSKITVDQTKKGLVEQIVIHKQMADWKNGLQNDFEQGVFDHYPLLKDLKTDLYNQGAIYASMTGTGSTIYGIFKEMPKLYLRTTVRHQIIAL